MAALADGPRPIDEIVRTIYADYPPEVWPLAARSVLAPLLKLADEGRAERTGKGDEAPWVATTPRTCERCGRPVGAGRATAARVPLALLQSEVVALAPPRTAPEHVAPGATLDPTRVHELRERQFTLSRVAPVSAARCPA